MTAEVIRNIYEQVGGERALILLGTKLSNCSYNNNTFIIRNVKSKKYNTIEIELNCNDLYNIKFYKFSITKNYEVKESNIKHIKDIYFDNLVSIIESTTKLLLYK